MVPDIVKNMESYLEEEGTSKKSKHCFRIKGFIKTKGHYQQVTFLGLIERQVGSKYLCEEVA